VDRDPSAGRRTSAEVDFLIDGKLIWSEDAAAYVFDGDDNGTNLAS